MRFSTVVGTDGKSATLGRRWNIPELSSPTVQTEDWASIPIWESEHSRKAGPKEPVRTRSATTSTHKPGPDSHLDEVVHQIPEVEFPCRRVSRETIIVKPRNNGWLRETNKKSLSQRLLGLTMALCIAVGLLGCMMERLSGELNMIESELEKRNVMPARDQDSNSFSHSLLNPTERRARQLAATGAEATNEKQFITHYNGGFWDNMKFQIGIIVRLVKFLNQGGEYGTTAALVNTLYKLSESSILPTAKDNAASTVLTSDHKTPSAFNQNPVQTGQALLHNDLQTAAISLRPVQSDFIPTHASARSHHIPKAAWTGSIFSKTVSGNPTSYNLLSSTTGHTNSPQNGDGISVVPVDNNQGNAQRINSVPSPSIHAERQSISFPIEAIDQRRREANFAPDPAHPVEGIVLWELPRGRSLCRVFNVARFLNGTLFLPKWMENYKETLAQHCGLKNAVYVFNSQTKDQLLKGQPSGNIRVDGTFANRDLFSPHTPRHHMPHFLSDIIPPLVATEVLLGSGREVVAYKCISAEEAGSTRLSRDLVYDVNPFLFLDMETVSKPPTHWVPSVARFFSHPNIGFELVPDLMSDRSSEPNGLSRFTLLRSVMLTNVNPYEPYGLFGADGKNHVFTYNGITREPTWTNEGMLKRPCIVSITVLTRKGHRALLELDKLQKVIKGRFIEQGLDLDFRVVDFIDTCFEDQVRIMQKTNVLIASHGAGNTNLVFMRPGATVIEVFPFSYKAGPFDGFAKVFGMEYKTAMSAPETSVFKACMRKKEKNAAIMKEVFNKWDKGVEQDMKTPWVHRLDFEKEFGEPGKSEGMTTRICARQQQLKFNIEAVAQMAVDSGAGQCHFSQAMIDQEGSSHMAGGAPRR
ncbi:transferase transferring glycosyl groups [Gracilaria domingensis]|nr:transferase transferring glycosyl groups [Gracilaria domingensis]